MSGLNPDGLGQSERFENSEHESLDTERGPTDSQIQPQNYPGDDLGEQINNAVSDLDDRQEVHIKVTGKQTISTPADLTDFRRVYFDGMGASLTVATADSIALDFTDSIDVRVAISELFGDSTDTPQAAILRGEADENSDIERDGADIGPERAWYWCGQAWGYWDYAPLIHLGRERTRVSGDWTNNSSQGYAFINSTHNDIIIDGASTSITSPTAGKTLTSTSSTSKLWVHRASFETRINEGDGLLYLEGDTNYDFKSTEFRSLGEPCVYLDASQDSIQKLSFEGTRARVGTLPTESAVVDFIYADDRGVGNSVNSISLSDIDLSLENDGTSGRVFGVDSTTALNTISFSGYMSLSGTDGVVPLTENVVVGNAVSSSTPDNVDGKVVFDGKSKQDAIRCLGSGERVENITAQTTAGGGGPVDAVAITSGTDKCLVRGVNIPQSDRVGILAKGDDHRIAFCNITNTDNVNIQINGNKNKIIGSHLDGELEIKSGATETVVAGTQFATLSDSGTRSVVNGHARNDGNPNDSGDWNGNATLAHRLGATVWDTSTSPWTPYQADGAGNWV